MKSLHTGLGIVFVSCLLSCALAPGLARAAGVTMIEEAGDGQYKVTMDGKHFTTLHTKGYAKPILYPIIGPHGVRMTRDYPMVEGTPGEAKDHPHHQSFWFDHGDVNGISFWDLGKGSGRIETTKVTGAEGHGDHASIQYEDQWVDAKGKVVCTDAQKMVFHNFRAVNGVEYAAIDYEITVKASEGDLVFGDTKEGSMGIRTNPGLRIDKGATAINSEWVQGKAIWGKRAKWVDYWADIDGHKVGMAIMDHPSNPRYPTWWHARDYGLVAANPFGISDFERKPKGTGDFKIQKGESVTFRYRVLVHGGDAAQVDMGSRFDRFAQGQDQP